MPIEPAGRKAPEPADAFEADFFARVPPDLAASFNPAQMMALRMAFGARHRGSHRVDIRLSFPGPRRRWYLVVLAGTERRSPARRRRERHGQRLASLANGIFAAIFFTALLMACLGFLYLLKSAFGIDLLPGTSLGLWDAVRDQARYLLQ